MSWGLESRRREEEVRASRGSRRKRTVVYDLTAFHLCCRHGHKDLVEFFIDREECKFDTLTHDRETPLHSAVQGHHLDICKELVKKARVPNMLGGRDLIGRTAFFMAAQEGNFPILKFLLTQTFRRKLDINEKGCKNGCNALIIACMKGYFDIAEYLIAKGLDVERKMKNGTRALHAAVTSGSVKLTRLLVEVGKVDKNAVDNLNRSALFLASNLGHFDVAEYLTELKCDLNIPYANAYTAQEIAIATKHNTIGFFIRDLQKEMDLERKARIKEANAVMAAKNFEATGEVKKKEFITKEEMALVNEFSRGRNLSALDILKFPSWDKMGIADKKKKTSMVKVMTGNV